MSNSQNWYIIKSPDKHCKIVSSQNLKGDETENMEKWGPFASQKEAIACRIGLIRSGKCQPQ
ncbi:MAG: DDE transposase family protein [Cyanobacteria bacterium P01_A01_bin.45]